jgi:hypothetical protein
MSRYVTLACALLAGLLAGLVWGLLTKRLGFNRRERLTTALVPALAARTSLSTYVLWPLGGRWDVDAPTSIHDLWRFSALSALTVACGAGVGVFVTGFRASLAEQPALAARDYIWLVAGLLVGCGLENFALYERFLHTYGELRCHERAFELKPCTWGSLPHAASPSLGSVQLELVRQALSPSPSNPFVRPTGIVTLTDPQTHALQVLGAAFVVAVLLALLLAVTHLEPARPSWRRWLARSVGGTVVLALGFAALVIARSRAAALPYPTTALLPTSGFRELVLIAAASVTCAGCLGAFLFASWGKGLRLACAFGVVSALTVLRRVLDDAVLPDHPYVNFEIDIHGARFGVEMYMLGACALLLALGLFPSHGWRTFSASRAASMGTALVVIAALVLFVRSLAFARDGQIQFTRFEAVDPRIARLKSCRVAYAWDAPLWIQSETTSLGSPVQSVELDRDAFSHLLSRFEYQLWKREQERPHALPNNRERLIGLGANLDQPDQDFRCVFVAAAAKGSVVVLAQRIEELETTIGTVTRVAELCGAGRIDFSDDESALPLDPHWTIRELLEQAREHRFNPRLDPDSLPPGCR